MSRLAVGLIGGGILAATKGFAQVDTRPDSAAPFQLAQSTPDARRGAREESTSAPESPVPPEAVIIGPSPGRSGSPGGAAEDKLPDLGSVGYRLAPIRWGGTTGSSVVYSQSTGATSLSTTQNLDLRANSFIYQPWFARIGANLGASSNESTSSSSGAGNSGSSSSNKVNATSFNYGADLSLFPVSRFPFQANFSQGSNIATAQDQSSVSSSIRFGMRQNYRPEQGPETYAANYDFSQATTSTGKSLVNSAGATFATSLDDHTLTSTLRYSVNSGDVGGQSSQLFNVNAAHSWHSDEDLRISTTAGFSNNQTTVLANTLSGSSLLANTSRLWQAGTSVFWVPDPDLPLTVTGAGNALTVQTVVGPDKNQLTNLSSQASATYRYSPKLGFSGGLSLGLSQSQTTTGPAISSVNSTQSLAVSYSGDNRKFYDFSHGWSTGGSASNSLSSFGGSQSQSSQSLGANASQSLSRVLVFGPVTTGNVHGSQSVSVNTTSAGVSTSTTGAAMSLTLSHSAGASLQSAYSQTLGGSLSLTGSDNFSTGQNQSHFRTLSAIGTGRWLISRRSNVNASANASWSQSVASATAIPGTSLTSLNNNTAGQWSGAGSISYNHANPFGVQNLQYGATYNFTTSRSNLRVAAGDPDATSWVISNTLMQRLDYVLGRVKFQLTASLTNIDSRTSTAVFFSMQRAFGDM